ncbi:MAG: DUF4870 domain-containing protein [Pyrinomonadaceae bacterium]
MMEAKKSKYDTNPLDSDVARKTEEVWGDSAGAPPTERIKGQTREVGKAANDAPRSNVYSEAPTRRIENPPLEAPYPSVFIPPIYAPPVQHPTTPPYQNSYPQRPTSRTVSGLGLPENWSVMLVYAPFFVGLVVSLIELFLCPRKEVKVRFHAGQALALHIGIIIIQTIFTVISTFTGSSLGGFLFRLATFVFLIVSMVRVWRGEPHRIAPLSEPAQWFNEHIEPRNAG